MRSRSTPPDHHGVAGIQLSGLASGLDTAGIIDQLIASERAPRDRMVLQQSTLQARQRVLGDLSSKLKALDDAARGLTSVSRWLPTQTLSSSDPAKVGLRALSTAAPGGYTVTTRQLASAETRTYAYTPKPQADTITIGSHSLPVAPNASVDDVVAAINGGDSLGVLAVAVDYSQTGTKSLVLVARKTGTANGFTATAASLTEDVARARPARDAEVSIDDGPMKTASSNVVANSIPGAELTLLGTGASTVRIGAPTIDKGQVTSGVQSFIGAYNAAVDALRSAVSERPVANVKTEADATKGTVYADPSLKAVLDAMRAVVSRMFGAPATALGRLSEIGVSTGAPTGGASTADSIAGKLTVDTSKLAAALDADPQAVRRLLGATDAGGGFAGALRATLKPYIDTGGVIDARVSGAGAATRGLTDRIAAFDDRMSRRQNQLRRQFTAMETALQRTRSQGDDLLAPLQPTRST